MELKTAAELVRKIMGDFNLESDDWYFEFSECKTLLGDCHYSKKRIRLSRPFVLLNSEIRVKNTILHEVAHALVGRGFGHSKMWKRKAISIGCSGDRTTNSSDFIAPPRKYTATCPKCGRETQAFKRTQVACGLCCKKYSFNKFDEKFRLVYTENKPKDND